ncbi:hypothetical protein PF008_g6479 [Phytophthora fragariae]|uniref:Uncharacterized protein n=1 Tax=Phytophthora fragariae TaxID=53985 RepID=A0A6G0S5F4_9STRA|nr:hypothetical protein PF008_g6479 [Phytophthora fragariae]
MVHLTHPAIHWTLRCIEDSSSSSDENPPPNVQPALRPDSSARDMRADGASSATGTATPLWITPERTKHGSKRVTNPPVTPEAPTAPVLPSSRARTSPTTSYPCSWKRLQGHASRQARRFTLVAKGVKHAKPLPPRAHAGARGPTKVCGVSAWRPIARCPAMSRAASARKPIARSTLDKWHVQYRRVHPVLS